TTLLRSQTRASFPNSRLKTPMVPGPHTSWVMRMSAFAQTFSPACTHALPAARARIFSVSVIMARGKLADCRADINCGVFDMMSGILGLHEGALMRISRIQAGANVCFDVGTFKRLIGWRFGFSLVLV